MYKKKLNGAKSAQQTNSKKPKLSFVATNKLFQ